MNAEIEVHGSALADHDARGGGPRLSVRGLRYAYRSREVLAGIDFEVGRGEIVGLLGPNGSGKSTALAVLVGLLDHQAGEVAFDGRRLTHGPDRAFRRAIGVCFQQPAVDQGLTARENLTLALAMQGMRTRDARRRVDEQLRLAGLAGRADDRLKTMSGGMRRRIDLVRAMAHGPGLLLMDEPTTGLDEASFRRIWDHVEAERRRTGLSVLVATHRPDEAARCDRLVVLDGGRVIADASPDALIARLGEGSRDVVQIEAADADDAAALARDITARFDVEALVSRATVTVTCERGHELLVRIVEAFERGRIHAIALARPSLADVFLKLSGARLDEPALETGQGVAADGAGEGAGR